MNKRREDAHLGAESNTALDAMTIILNNTDQQRFNSLFNWLGATIFTKCLKNATISLGLLSFLGKSCEISELSAMSIIMTTHQNVGNLKRM